MTMTTDTDLILGTAAGDSEAFETLYRRHHDKLWAVAAGVTGAQDAEDALQEGWLNVYRQASRFRGDAAVSSWLYRIVRNAAYDLVRRRKLVAAPDTEPSYQAWRIRAADQRIVIAKHWQRLTPDQQLAVYLTDIADMPVEQAAEVAGVSEGTIKSRAFRGRQVLARFVPRQCAWLTPDASR